MDEPVQELEDILFDIDFQLSSTPPSEKAKGIIKSEEKNHGHV